MRPRLQQQDSAASVAVPSAPTRAARGRALRIAAIGALYVALALASTWPLGARLASSLPLGTDRAATVPLVETWSLWWVADRLGTGFDGFWDAPIFHPTPGAFLLSEPLPLLGMLAAPLLALGATPVLAHNLLLLAALVANAVAAAGLLRALGLAPLAAISGGAMMLTLPYVQHELGVLVLVPIAAPLGCLWALLAFQRRRSLGSALAIGLCAAATYLICSQYGPVLALVVAPAALALVGRRWFEARALARLAAGALLCALLVAPLVSAQLEYFERNPLQRDLASAIRGSSHPTAWFYAPWPSLLTPPGIETAPELWMQAHFPGSLKLLLAGLGIAAGLRRREWRRPVIFLITIALLAALYSALPRLSVASVSPYRILVEWVPGISKLRSFWRAIAFSQMSVALLAALGLQFLADVWRVPADRTELRRRRAMLLAALGAWATLELWPPPQHLHATPDFSAWKDWNRWIERHVGAGGSLLHLPMPASGSVSEFEETASWMLLATRHQRPIANGYSSYFPRHYQLLERSLRGCPDATAYRFARDLGHDLLVIRTSWLAEHPACAPPEAEWERAARFSAADVEIHRWRDAQHTGALPPTSPTRRSRPDA